MSHDTQKNEVVNTTNEVKNILTSEKLESLKQAVKDANKAYKESTEENEEASLNFLLSARKAVQAEEANLKAFAIEQAKREARDKKIAYVTNFEEAIKEHEKAFAKYQKKGLSIEEMNEETAKLKTLRDELINLILGTSAKVTTVQSDGPTVSREGSKASYCVDYYTKRSAEGATKSEIEAELRAEGLNDGTVNNAINAYLKSIGQK